MNRPKLEVADVFRRYGEAFRETRDGTLAAPLRRVIAAVTACRTAALGAQVERCDQCGHRRFHYRSCRNRHCPKCQWAARTAWLDSRHAELLDCQYFHVVFTLPRQLADLALRNRKAVFTILFHAAAATLTGIAADPQHLGARIGFLAILHTWGQQLQFHPHLHCVVPGGGPDPAGERWIACRPGFFLPVRVLSRRFRTLFLARLQQAFRDGALALSGPLAPLADEEAFDRFLRSLRQVEWVVYSKRPFDGPARVLEYLARYTHRVAISNHRLLSIADGRVRFRWRDYRHHGKLKTLSLTAAEFIRRFLLHVLPSGFQRIRYYGLLAARCRKQRLALCRRLLGMADAAAPAPARPGWRERYEQLTGQSLSACPACGVGRMCLEGSYGPGELPPEWEDTS